jgi:hypothetical protein
MDSLEVTEELSAKGATHPRVSLDDIKDAIAGENYLNVGDAVCRCGQDDTAPMHLMTLCLLTMRNGFLVIGKSAPASPENFDAEKGKTFAKEDAIRQLWPLMGYSLRDRLAAG